jgi:DNA-directed RNA polymerase specialized sigma subunit
MIYDNLFVVSLPEPFSKEEVYSYFKKMYEGDKIARDEIIKHNLRLVVSESKKYVSEYYEQEYARHASLSTCKQNFN